MWSTCQRWRVPGGVYHALRARLAKIVTAHCDTPVPACPGWHVHEVVAHLAGLCEDWVSGRLDGYATEPWTAHQVSRYAHRTCDEILHRWADTITSFARLETPDMRVPPAALGVRRRRRSRSRRPRRKQASDRVPNDAVLLGLHGTMARWQDGNSSAGRVFALSMFEHQTGRTGGWEPRTIRTQSCWRHPCTTCSAPSPDGGARTRSAGGIGPPTPNPSSKPGWRSRSTGPRPHSKIDPQLTGFRHTVRARVRPGVR